MRREIIDPPELKDSNSLGYSHGRIEGETLYISGQVGVDGDGDVVGEDVRTQTRKALENVETILDRADCGFDDVATTRAYLVNLERDIHEFREVWLSVFDQPYPCQTLLGVKALASNEYLVEIEAEVPLVD